jgi:hypothetical protein
MFRKGLSAVTSAGIGAAAIGSGIGSKILPFINRHIPLDMAVKGINKVSPDLGKFLKKGVSEGLKVEDGLQYIKNQIESTGKENRNVIEQYSPELNNFMKGLIQSGKSPLEAGALAQLEGKKGFKKIIDKITKDHKADWSAIIQNVYGSGQIAQKNQQAPQQIQPQGQTGQGQQALMQMMQMINQKIGQ